MQFLDNNNKLICLFILNLLFNVPIIIISFENKDFFSHIDTNKQYTKCISEYAKNYYLLYKANNKNFAEKLIATIKNDTQLIEKNFKNFKRERIIKLLALYNAIPYSVLEYSNNKQSYENKKMKLENKKEPLIFKKKWFWYCIGLIEIACFSAIGFLHDIFYAKRINSNLLLISILSGGIDIYSLFKINKEKRERDDKIKKLDEKVKNHTEFIKAINTITNDQCKQELETKLKEEIGNDSFITFPQIPKN